MANEALLLLLILGWAAVLLPSAIRSRRRSTLASVGGFERAMDVLRNRPDGRQVMVPRDADRANRIVLGREGQQVATAVGRDVAAAHRLPSRQTALLERRRQLFLRVLAADGLLLVLGAVFGGMFWTLFLLGAGVLGGYATLLRHYKVERDQARQVVRTIDIREFDEPTPAERELMAVGAERYAEQYGERYEGLQVAKRPDEPWEPQSGVRIRRWN
jgi:hypothetical protein